MEDIPLSREMRVEERRVAAIFVNSDLRRIVLSMVQRPRSLAELSVALGMDLKRLHHHVQKFRQLGLVAVVGEQPRAGRPIKLYQATADRYFVPHGVAPEPIMSGLALELRTALDDDADRSGAGTLFFVDPRGEPMARFIRNAPVPHVAEMWRILRLTAAEAEALETDLRAVLQNHEARNSGRGRPYLVHAALAPRGRSPRRATVRS